MFVDFSTTNYALSHGIGREGSPTMSGIVSNPILFILTKLIGSMVIIFMMKICIERNKKISFIGMRLIIFMMIFVVVNNIMVISASALSFSNQSVGGTGSVNTANGYFDDEGGQFGYTGSRNVYTLAEDTQIWIIEPISASSAGGQFAPINSSLGTIRDAVVHQGYLYFIDGTTLKKKKTRGTTGQCESTDTTAGGCILVIATGVDSTALRVYNNNLYFIVGGVLKTIDEDDNTQTVFSISGTAPGGGTVYPSFAVTSVSGELSVYLLNLNVNDNFRKCTASGCTISYSTGYSGGAKVDTVFATTNYLYLTWYCSGCGLNPTGEFLIRISNNTATAVDYASSDTISISSRAYVGGQSTIGLIAQSTTVYETFNSIEVGAGDSLPSTPSDITYTTKTIESLDSQYYNKSDIYLQYNVVINSVNVNNLLLDLADYRWMISMTDPNGVTTDIIQSPACSTDSIFDTSCQVTSTMGIHAPPNGWLQGSWYAKLYEINTVTGNRALITTSSAFTVLNTSLENQSVIPPSFEPPTSGTGPQAITIIDRFVGWLGLGVNSVSKLLFAMIIIAIAATVGLLKGNGNVAMVFAFVPYAFFTFIDYIPKWIFIIAIILIAIVSKAFR